MKKTMLSVCAALASAFAAAESGENGEEREASVFDRAKEMSKIVDRYCDSIAVARYWIKDDSSGDKPDFRIPYKCPNCGGTHYSRGEVSVDMGIPAEFAAFVIDDDKAIMADLRIEPRFIDRIELECAGETIAAAEFERCPDNGALILKTERPFGRAKKIAFTGKGAPDEPGYFSITSEGGERIAGLYDSAMDDFKRHVEAKCDVYEIKQNTIVIDEDANPVTIAFQTHAVLGGETFSSPNEWRREKADETFKRDEAFAERLKKAVFPVNIQLEAPKKNDSIHRRFSRFSNESRNEIDSVLVAAGSRLFIPVGMNPETTARIVRMTARMPDGSKADLEFEGSFLEHGAISVRFAGGKNPAVKPLEIDTRGELDFFMKKLKLVCAENRDGTLRLTFGEALADGFARKRGNKRRFRCSGPTGAASASSSRANAFRMMFSDGAVAAVGVGERTSDSVSYDEESSGTELQGAELAAFVSSPLFDPENVPRKAGDRQRRAWLGVEVQKAGVDALREKKALSFFPDQYRAESAAMVLSVAKGSPAEAAGLKAGDILLDMRQQGSESRTHLEIDDEPFSAMNWPEIFADERFIEFGNMGEITPWPNAEGGVNGIVAKFGVGAKVVVSWVSDGVRREARTVLALQPVHFQNAPRSRNKELGMTVADMTDEVRRYFKLGEKDSGVVVSKVKSGGVAAVAGLKPLELVLQVNGEDVSSAKDFISKTKGKKDLTLKVQRLTTTRMVPIKL